jgi:Cof subfamily protein (haloacid dehalogenase superfamily)
MSEWGVISQTTKAALRAARRRGHLIYICTGRVEIELVGLLDDVEYDGVIGAGGCSVESGGERLWRSCFSTADLATILAELDAADLAYYEQTPDALIPSPTAVADLQARIDDFLALGQPDEVRLSLDEFMAWFDADRPLLRDDVYKFVYLGSQGVDMAAVSQRLAGVAELIGSSIPLFGEDAGEVLQVHLTKASGMAWLVDHLGLDRADSLALGDSVNDVEMLQWAGVGIAMGNASPEAIAAADEVTTSVAEEGVTAAFLRHGLIDAWPVDPPRTET